ncbi:MAG: hypothetical protein ACPGO3_04485 [Magnetospiraceae bacterium]
MYELIALFAVGLVAALGGWAAFRTFRRKPPRYVIPLAAGLSMIGFHLWNGYTWHQRTIDLLPEGVVVVETLEDSFGWEPWTYLFPQVVGFVAVDLASIKWRDDAPGFRLVETFLVKRRESTVTAKQMFDCQQARWVGLSDATPLDARGIPLDDQWIPVKGADPMFAAVCEQVQQ